MADRRIAITGLGVATPSGIGIEPMWQALMAGKQSVKRLDRFDASGFPCHAAGQLDDFSARNYVPKDYRKAVKVMARDTEIAVAAADLAFRDSGIITRGIDPDRTNINPERLGCNIGAGLICSDLNELGAAVNTAVEDGKFSMKLWGSTGMNNLTPLWLLKYLPNMLSCHVTIIHGAEGPSNCITCGDASGTLAIGEAARYISRGAADAVVAGAAESRLIPMGLLRQSMLKRLVTTANDSPGSACRPFDKDACGTVIGEGGGLVILEDLEIAKARGARIYAELAGFGGACDPNGIDILTPSAGGMELAVRNALADAKISAKEVGAIFTHGTCVPAEDRCEAAAWRISLGEVAGKVPAVAITGGMGLLFVGHGGVSVAVAAMSLYKNTMPPTINFAAPAPGCGLNLSAQARHVKMDYAVIGSYTVGGQSGAIVLKRYEA